VDRGWWTAGGDDGRKQMSGGEEALEAGRGISQCRVVVVESVAVVVASSRVGRGAGHGRAATG
jgi:5-formyltetrahydrofolate cyclo-ligase